MLKIEVCGKRENNGLLQISDFPAGAAVALRDLFPWDQSGDGSGCIIPDYYRLYDGTFLKTQRR